MQIYKADLWEVSLGRAQLGKKIYYLMMDRLRNG